MQNYCFTTYLPNVSNYFFATFCKLFANSLICRYVLQQGFSTALQGWIMLHLNFIRARVYAYTYSMLHEPFTLFTPLWKGRFLHLHQNIYNNHCNTATKAYHTMNQRTMVTDHLQRAMAICNTTVTDVADGFQHICHRNALIFRCTDFRCRCVCDSI